MKDKTIKSKILRSNGGNITYVTPWYIALCNNIEARAILHPEDNNNNIYFKFLIIIIINLELITLLLYSGWRIALASMLFQRAIYQGVT